MRKSVPACVLILMSTFVVAAYGDPIPFTNYAALCQEDLQWTAEGVPYGSHWSWRFSQGPFTWRSDDDAPLPNWSMSAFAREEDIWAGGSSLTVVAHEPGDPSAVRGTMLLGIQGLDHAMNLNADDAIVDEDAGLIMTSFGYPNLPGQPSTIITETLEKTGVFENIELVGDQNIYFNGHLFVRRIEGMDVQENIIQAITTEGPMGGFCTAVWDGEYIVLPPGIGNNPGLDGRIPPGLRDGLPLQSRHSIPEPTTAVLLLSACGIGCLVWGRRRLTRHAR
jgi:hypothetical protein